MILKRLGGEQVRVIVILSLHTVVGVVADSKVKCMRSNYLQLSPVVKNGFVYQSKEVIRARGRDYDPGSPGKIHSEDNFGI